MYETTVSVCKSGAHLLSYVKEQIAPYVRSVDGITTELEETNRSYFSFACSDTFRFQIQRNLLSAVSEALSLGYKNVYMRKLLETDCGNFYHNVLINTICVFDNDYDKQQIAKVVETDKPLYIDGYYNFRLSALKRKWEELSKLVCENGYILSDDGLVTEFLQYLLESIPCKIRRLSIEFSDNGFTLYNSGNKAVVKLRSLAPNATPEEEALLNAICLKPQKITVYSKNAPSKDFCDLAERLFDTEYVKVE